MVDKKMDDTTDQELMLEYIGQLKADNKRLNEELKKRKQTKVLFSGDGIKRAFEHWTWGTIVVVGVILGIIYTLYFIWPSTYETGRFYLAHSMKNYDPPPPPPEKEWDDCYKIIKEYENGRDEVISNCFRDKDEAYRVANEFANEWRRLKDKATQEAESYE
jgi:hypothetical protein